MTVLFENFDQKSPLARLLILRERAQNVLENNKKRPILKSILKSDSDSEVYLASSGESPGCAFKKTHYGDVIHVTGKMGKGALQLQTLGYGVGSMGCPIAFALVFALSKMDSVKKHTLTLTLIYFSEYVIKAENMVNSELKTNEFSYTLHPPMCQKLSSKELVNFYARVLFDFQNAYHCHNTNINLGNIMGCDLYEFNFILKSE